MAKLKYIILTVLVLTVASGAGYYAAVHYNNTRQAIQVEKDKQQALKDAAKAEQEAKAAALKEKKRQQQELRDRQLGLTEEPDEVIRGLTADMQISQDEAGSTIYSYDEPQEDGIFLQPYLVRNTDGTAAVRVRMCHRGKRPMGFRGIALQVDNDNTIAIMATSPVTTVDTDSGIMEVCDQSLDSQALQAMRAVAEVLGGRILMLGVAGGSEDDRALSATEGMRVRNMLMLADIFNGKRST